MFAQQQHDRRRFFGMAALSLAACVDWHERFGDSVDHGETVPTIRRKRPGLARSGDSLAQFSATDGGGPSGQSRARRLLDLHLHQLASHTAIRSRVGRPVQGTRAGRHRRAHTRIHVRGRRRQRATGPQRREASLTRSPSTTTARSGSGFGNHYWPALYFIDAAGQVRDHHFGEGNYEESEMRIRQLLAAAGAAAGSIVSPFPSRRMVQRWTQTGAA